MLKQDLKDGDLNTMWSGESGGVAGTNSYKTWSLRPWRCAMSSIAAMASFTPPRSEVDTPCPTNISNECRLPTGDSMARLALRQRRGPFQLKPPGTLVPLSLFYNVWCPSPTQATKPHWTGHVHNPISVLQTRALNMFAATLTLQRVWLQGAMKIQLLLSPQSTYYS